MTSAGKLIFAGVVAALLPGLSHAQDTRNQGYLVDTNGSIVTSATTGLCVRDRDWTPAREAACNPTFPPALAMFSTTSGWPNAFTR